MASDLEAGDERTPLLRNEHDPYADTASSSSSNLSKQELQVGSAAGERLPYNDYTTIDWLHDLVKDSARFRQINALPGLRYRLLTLFDACSGWIVVVIIGALTAVVAFLVDVAVASVADWKTGYCSSSPWKSRENCCRQGAASLAMSLADPGSAEPLCQDWHPWSDDYARSFSVYVALALLYGIISSSVTMLTRSQLPSAEEPDEQPTPGPVPKQNAGKVMYMAAGSGIPEIKTILGGFNIPSFLSLKVLLVKAFGAVFAVSTGMCLGKEGPFVHISTCVGYLVGSLLPKYAGNGRNMRELLSAACSSGLSVAFGAPIGGVLFSYEEISTYFPRKVLWRAVLCSLTAAIVLKALNPTGTGKLVLFETNYVAEYRTAHYLVFTLLGIAGGVFGGLFCKLNFLWSKAFRAIPVIKQNPVFEVVLVVLATALLQFPNPLIREPGDIVIKSLLVDCADTVEGFVCMHEARPGTNWPYIAFLVHGTLTKLALTIVTFGCKVPSGVIIPALDAGALFGRLIGYTLSLSSSEAVTPGIFALVGAAAFLAGVSRMTISLAVIMFELSGSLTYGVPNLLAILVAKWVADAISHESVYDLAQTVAGHPFLDADAALLALRSRNLTVASLIPPQATMDAITVTVPGSNCVPASLLRDKLAKLRERGLMDAGLVLVQVRPPSTIPVLQGYIAQSALAQGLEHIPLDNREYNVRIGPGPDAAADSGSSSNPDSGSDSSPDSSPRTPEIDLRPLIDSTPLTLSASAPIEYAVELFGKLGVRVVCVTAAGTGACVGVVLKKRVVGFIEGMER